MSTRFDDDVIILGALTPQSFNPPAGSIDDTAVKAAAGIAADKLEHQYAIHYSQADGSDVAAAIVPVHTVRGVTATIADVEVVCLDAPNGGDKQFTVDLQKCNQGAPTPATVLSSVVTIDSTVADCEVKTATLSSASLADGDTLVVVVTVSGATGVQGQGLIVTVTLREDAD